MRVLTAVVSEGPPTTAIPRSSDVYTRSSDVYTRSSEILHFKQALETDVALLRDGLQALRQGLLLAQEHVAIQVLIGMSVCVCVCSCEQRTRFNICTHMYTHMNSEWTLTCPSHS